MANVKNIATRKFGWLTALHPTGQRSPQGDVLWLLRCRCGNEVVRKTADLLKKPKRDGQVPRTCGCQLNVRGRVYISKYGQAGDLGGHRFGMMQTSAKHRGHAFTVTIEYVWDLFLGQGRKCALTGVPLAMSKKAARPGEALASLDRVASEVGYVPGNVQWVHPTINFMKHAMPQDQFVEWCRLVTAHRRA